MDLVRSHFGKMQLWQVDHFFLHKKVPVYYYTVIVFNFLELHFSEVTSYQIHTLAPHVFSSNWRGINDFFFCECVYVVRRTWSFSPKGHDHIYIFFTYPLETESGITRGCRYFVKRLPKLKLSSICITIRQFNFLTYFDACFFT
jgi:hypothetical protein